MNIPPKSPSSSKWMKWGIAFFSVFLASIIVQVGLVFTLAIFQTGTISNTESLLILAIGVIASIVVGILTFRILFRYLTREMTEGQERTTKIRLRGAWLALLILVLALLLLLFVRIVAPKLFPKTSLGDPTGTKPVRACLKVPDIPLV